MRALQQWALAGGILWTGCYSTREILNDFEEGLPQGIEVRQVSTSDGALYEFTDSLGEYGVVADSVVTGVTERQGAVRIPIAQVTRATVRELNVFGTALGVAGVAAVSYIVLNAILGSSGDAGGSSGGTGGSGGGGGSG